MRRVIFLVNKKRDYIVSFDPSDNIITCSCRKFESFDFMYCHALKVCDINDIKLLPDQYIILRWTKKVRAGVICDVRAKEIYEDLRLDITRFRDLS